MANFRGFSSSVLEIDTKPRILATGQFAQPLTTNGNDIEALILESVDEALGDLLGRRAREAVYDYLERNAFMARSEIPKNLGEFFSVLEATFGKGSKTIGKVIAKKLYAKLHLEFVEQPNAECADYVELARSKLQK
jgi:hypothetical protein